MGEGDLRGTPRQEEEEEQEEMALLDFTEVMKAGVFVQARSFFDAGVSPLAVGDLRRKWEMGSVLAG